MIIGTGTDIIEITRIKKIMENHKFYKKMFTETEIEYLQSKEPESTAGYFCAKEAVSKAIGTGFAGFKFTDIEILKRNGAPYVRLKGNAQKISSERGIRDIHVSISHCHNYATAVAVAEGEKIISDNNIARNEYPLSILKNRQPNGHKGDYGRIYIIGGSYSMSGAIILSSKAALRSGAGLVTNVIPKSILDRVGSNVVEATYMPCEELEGLISLSSEEIDIILEKADAVAIGIGIGISPWIKGALHHIILNSPKPVIIDADALTMLSEDPSILKEAKAEIVLTPHVGEMSRLIRRDTEFIINNRVEVARSFAAEFGCTLLLKGKDTIVTNGKSVYINKTGNPGMATGGSGDVLTGIIAGLIGQGYGTFDAASLGAYMHGAAGDAAYDRYGYGLAAGDIIDFLGNYLKG